MALGSTESLTEMHTSNLPRGKGRPARKTDNFTVICEPIVYTSGSQLLSDRGQVIFFSIRRGRGIIDARARGLRNSGLENVGASTSQNLMCLHGLLQG
jgi:hypothetical protein